MNVIAAARPPAWYWIVSGLALVWNLLGVVSYLLHAYDHPSATAGMTAEQIAFQASVPFWVTGAYAIAVFGGSLAAIGLLVRKSWAKLFFIVSLVALVVQQFWAFVLSDALTVLGAQAAIVPAIVLVVAILLLWFASSADRRGWLR